jgi:uncharacterized protein (UPF0264 family)
VQLLVSVSNAGEAAAAVAGGTDIVDAKDPHSGALGAVTSSVFVEIHHAVGGACTVSAAAGDASGEADIEGVARALTAAGAAFVKVGFAGVVDSARVSELIAAAVRGSRRVVAVAYADAASAGSLTHDTITEAAARSGAAGILLDTADKNGPALRELIRPRALASWIARAHGANLFVAVAGRLTAEDLDLVRDAGADIAGVRGAACEDGRRSRISETRVRRLSRLCGTNTGRLHPNLEQVRARGDV